MLFFCCFLTLPCATAHASHSTNWRHCARDKFLYCIVKSRHVQRTLMTDKRTSVFDESQACFWIRDVSNVFTTSVGMYSQYRAQILHTPNANRLRITCEGSSSKLWVTLTDIHHIQSTLQTMNTAQKLPVLVVIKFRILLPYLALSELTEWIYLV